MDCNPLHCFPLSFPTAQATEQLDSSLLQTDYPPSPLLISKYWTDGSVPSLFGPGGAGVYVTCSKCHTSNSLSFSTGPITSSFTAETFGLKQRLDWCTSHLMICKFQSVLFQTDSRLALSILSSAPSYLLPESLWNVWSLASSLSNDTTLKFQWIPGHAGLPGNEKADLLAKAGASLSTDAIPCPLPPVVAKVRYFQYHNWRRHISRFYLSHQVPEVSSEELLLFALFAVSFPVFAAITTVFFYLHIFTESVGRRILLVVPVDTLYRTSIISSSTVLRKSIFGSSLSILDLWSRPWGVARLLGPLEGVGLYHHYQTANVLNFVQYIVLQPLFSTKAFSIKIFKNFEAQVDFFNFTSDSLVKKT